MSNFNNDLSARIEEKIANEGISSLNGEEITAYRAKLEQELKNIKSSILSNKLLVVANSAVTATSIVRGYKIVDAISMKILNGSEAQIISAFNTGLVAAGSVLSVLGLVLVHEGNKIKYSIIDEIDKVEQEARQRSR